MLPFILVQYQDSTRYNSRCNIEIITTEFSVILARPVVYAHTGCHKKDALSQYLEIFLTYDKMDKKIILNSSGIGDVLWEILFWVGYCIKSSLSHYSGPQDCSQTAGLEDLEVQGGQKIMLGLSMPENLWIFTPMNIINLEWTILL